MPSSTCGIAMLALASLNIIIALVGVIYANVGMSSWDPAKFNDLVAACDVEISKGAKLPGDAGKITPLACFEADLLCGDTKCHPGEYCVEKADEANGIKVGTCERCTNSKLQDPQQFPGASKEFDFKGTKYLHYGNKPLNVEKRCEPFVKRIVGNNPTPQTFDDLDGAYQQHGGVYMCAQEKYDCFSDSCVGKGLGLFEGSRLNTLICPKSSPFPSGLPSATSDQELLKRAGGLSTLSLCYTPILVGAVVTIIAAIVIAIGGMMVMNQKDSADIFVKVAFAAGAIAVVVSLGCTIATSVGAGNIMKESKDIVARDKESILLDLTLQGDEGNGDLRVVGCPKSCRLVKGAMGNYLEAFAGFANVNLGLLVAQLILNAAAMMCIIMGLCCFKGDGDNDKGTQRQKVKAVYKAPAANKKAKQPEPAVTSQTKIDRRKSMATRAVPIAPDNKGGDTPKEVGEILVAVYDFKGDGPEELNFFEGDKIELIEEFSDGWANGRLCDDTGGTGIFPLNYTMGKGGRV